MARKQKTEVLETVKRVWIALVYGVMSAVGVNMFLMHANSYSSGLLGLSQLLQTIFLLFHVHVSMSFLMAIFNIPLFIFAWRVFGMRYILFSGLAVLANIVFLAVIPKVLLVTEPLTNTLVGASLIGMSVGWCFNNGFTTGGVDILVTYCQKRFHKNVGMFANVINGFILLGAVIFFGPGRIVYSLIGMLVTNGLMDYMYVSQTDVSVTIYTKHAQKLIKPLQGFAHGATLLHGTGTYTGEPTDIILVVTPRGQLAFIKKMVKSLDPEGFISIQRSDVELGKYRHYSM
ncbi:YitT family protein [uncultured Limosilactobacillus sp.]|uniref:YitT family protein n=1 Tax=uncultured Limosilactobacillus sp. TaxID=2837629 RepID=UPI0025F6F9E0|nr:YitT family protein [uncultured Limosilactobacillus sp.]